MAIDGSYRIAEDLSRQGLDYRRQRDSEIGQRLLGVVPTFHAALKGGPGAASAVAERWRPHHTDPAQFAAEKANLKLKLMKQLQDYESSRLNGIADIVRTMRGNNNMQAELFKAILRANGVDSDSVSSADKGRNAALAKMSGDFMGFVSDALEESGVNPAGMSRIMESVFQNAMATNGNWLGAGGPLEMLAQQVMSSVAAGEPEVAYAAITVTATRMAMQDKDLRAILEANQDNKLYKYLYDQMKEADKWADASGAKLKMVGAAIGFQERMMQSLGSDIASDPSVPADKKQAIKDSIEMTNQAMKDLNLSATDGKVSVMDIDRVIDKVEPGESPAMGKDQVLSLLQEIDQWKGNPSLAQRRQQLMQSESFQKFKADLGLRTDEIAFKELMRRNALQVHQDRQADRATLRQGTQSSQPFPRPASASMVSQTASPPATPAPQGTPPTPANTGKPDGVIEPGNIDLNNRPVVKNGNGYSTVLSMSFGEDGVEILVPMVSDDGTIMTEDQAKEQYHRTGKHLGKFATPEAATAYAEQLHQEQEAQYGAQAAAAPVEEGPPLYAIGPDSKPWRLSPDRKEFRPATDEELQAVEEAQRAIADAGYDDKVIGGPEQYAELESQYKAATATPSPKPEQKPAQQAAPVIDVQAPPSPVVTPQGVNPMTGKQAVEKPILPGLGSAINDIGFTLAHPSLQAQRAISEIRDDNIFQRDAQKPKRVKKKRNPFTEDFDTTGLGDFTATP